MADLAVGIPVALSIRPHEIELLADQPNETITERGDNLLRGSVQRASCLGDVMDCQVQVEGSDVILRVAAPPGIRFPLGEAISLAVAPSACIPLAEWEEWGP